MGTLNPPSSPVLIMSDDFCWNTLIAPHLVRGALKVASAATWEGVCARPIRDILTPGHKFDTECNRKSAVCNGGSSVLKIYFQVDRAWEWRQGGFAYHLINCSPRKMGSSISPRPTVDGGDERRKR